MYGGDPPCEKCEKPSELIQANTLAMRMWRLCSKQRGMVVGMGGSAPSPLTIQAVHHICLVYDSTRSDFEKVLAVEHVLFPVIQKAFQKGSA